MSLVRAHRIAFALTVLVAQAAAFAHLAIADHTLSEKGHLIEVSGHHEAAPEGVGAADDSAARGTEERCPVFEATRAPLELAGPAVPIELEKNQQLAGGNVRRGFVRCALVDAPKASPPPRV